MRLNPKEWEGQGRRTAHFLIYPSLLRTPFGCRKKLEAAGKKSVLTETSIEKLVEKVQKSKKEIYKRLSNKTLIQLLAVG